MMPVMDPPVVRHLSADRGSRRRDVGQRLCPPLWQYFSCLPHKGGRVHPCPPKGRGSQTQSFPLQTGLSRAVRRGIIAILDPRHPLRG
jgi:hypothetical protein